MVEVLSTKNAPFSSLLIEYRGQGNIVRKKEKKDRSLTGIRSSPGLSISLAYLLSKLSFCLSILANENL